LEDRPHSQFGQAEEAQNLYPEIYHICGGIGHNNSGLFRLVIISEKPFIYKQMFEQ